MLDAPRTFKFICTRNKLILKLCLPLKLWHVRIRLENFLLCIRIHWIPCVRRRTSIHHPCDVSANSMTLDPSYQSEVSMEDAVLWRDKNSLFSYTGFITMISQFTVEIFCQFTNHSCNVGKFFLVINLLVDLGTENAYQTKKKLLILICKHFLSVTFTYCRQTMSFFLILLLE